MAKRHRIAMLLACSAATPCLAQTKPIHPIPNTTAATSAPGTPAERAQDTNPGAQRGVAEIVVTAQRRSINPQRTALAISAVFVPPATGMSVGARFLPVIKQATDAIVNVTNGGAVTMTVQDRLAAALAFGLEMSSINTGSIDFAFLPAAKRITRWKQDWEEGYVVDSDGYLFCKTFRDNRSMLETGRDQMPFLAQAVLMAGNVRVWLQDSPFFACGKLARLTAEQIVKIVRILGEMEHERAPPGEAKVMLGLKGGDRLEF